MTPASIHTSSNPDVDAFILESLPATFAQLHTTGERHFGEDVYRKVDARLQSLRKRGLIRFSRVKGVGVVWEKVS